MAQNSPFTELVSLSATAAVLLIAYGFDRWVEILRKLGQRVFNPYPALWLGGVSQFIVAGCILLLAWWVVRSRRSAMVASILVLIGLGIVLYPAVAMSVARWIPLPGWPLLNLSGQRLVYVGASLTMMGLFQLFWRKAKR